MAAQTNYEIDHHRTSSTHSTTAMNPISLQNIPVSKVATNILLSTCALVVCVCSQIICSLSLHVLYLIVILKIYQAEPIDFKDGVKV